LKSQSVIELKWASAGSANAARSSGYISLNQRRISQVACSREGTGGGVGSRFGGLGEVLMKQQFTFMMATIL
jgi:hypothetical protein